jgi:hypothetical protein
MDWLMLDPSLVMFLVGAGIVGAIYLSVRLAK